MKKINMENLIKLHKGARGTGGITSRDGQQFLMLIYEQFPEIYLAAKNIQHRANVFSIVLENISQMGVIEAGKRAPAAARCVLDDMEHKVIS